MVTHRRLFSAHCCGGPVVLLTLVSISFGLLFLLLSAIELAVVFILAGSVAILSCLYLGSSRCGRINHKSSLPTQ
jgi:tetrahydromethanopterin S-methyltransferase subunit E